MKIFATTRCRKRRFIPLVLWVTVGVVASSAAWAQIGSGPVGTTGRAGRGASSAPEKPPVPPPEATPGAKPRDAAAPATRPASDMQPTDALFDAINRGDVAAARDALNRGADLNGVNILGMTPMELSVDLGRNDISFLLLSMRGEDSDRGSRALGRDTPAAPTAGRSAQAGKPTGPGRSTAAISTASAGARGRSVPNRPAQAAANTLVPAKPVATPRLFANDGGVPVPSAGFLGFDARSASN